MKAIITQIHPARAPHSYYALATSAQTSPHTRTIHIAGQPGTLSPSSNSNAHPIIPSDYESQIHLALLNFRKSLIAAGAEVKNILSLRLYIVEYDAENRVHARHLTKFLSGHKPAITLVPVAKLAIPGWLFEIEGVAVVQDGISSDATPISAPVPKAPSTVVPSEKYDVLIVGAGLSGLTTARDVLKAGLSCLVLEARDRVGGKTWSQNLPLSNATVDVGAAWINDTNQGRVHALAKEIGATLIEQNTDGKCVFQGKDGGVHQFEYGKLPNFDKSIQDNVAYIRDLCEAECQKLDPFAPANAELDSITFEAFLRQNGACEEAVQTGTTWTRAMLGQEPRDMSALYFLNYCKAGGGLLQMRSDRKNGGQYLRFKEGTQSLSIGLANMLPKDTVRLNSPALAIRQHAAQDVEIMTKDGIISARKVCLSVPGPCLKDITFEPALPETNKVFASSLTYGYYAKFMILFKKAFWISEGLCGLSQSFLGPAAVIRDTSIPGDDKHVLTCFMGGDLGQAWALRSEEDRLSSVLKQVARLFTKENDFGFVKEQYVEHVVYEWCNDQWAGWGCPCTALPPGVLNGYGDVLAQRIGDLHFVGTETAGYWKGYMEGAMMSGERGAAEIVHELEKQSRSRL